MSTNVHTCNTEDAFKSLLKKAASQIVVLHFEADWAPECVQMNQVIDELANEYKHTIFIKVEAEQLEDVSKHYEVECVPTFIILKEMKIMDKVEGADAANLTKKVKHYATSYVAPIVISQNEEMSLEERLQKLISASPCMLFMKGSPETPKCGFSKQIIDILKEHSVKFDTFDILSDNEVRQGLKKLSDWPTYPQLYANGELLGGLDIVKELSENAELKDMLPCVEDLQTRLLKLVKKAPVMVFMKGEPKQPRCKFSRALMEIFNKISVTFESFDILEDDEVRQGLKGFSNWPTFPQIYVNGEFIGGLDIIKELDESDELVSALTPS